MMSKETEQKIMDKIIDGGLMGILIELPKDKQKELEKIFRKAIKESRRLTLKEKQVKK